MELHHLPGRRRHMDEATETAEGRVGSGDLPAVLYEYQRAGVTFLRRNRRAYLADEMGLGKTVQAVVAAKESGPASTLVVCPASVVENWKREWAAWGGPPGLEVVSYNKLIRRVLTETMLFDLVILDEAHYCKSPGAKRTKAALAVAMRAKQAWLLSGTPMPNHATELFSVFKALWPTYCAEWGTTTAFKWLDFFCNWAESDYGPRVWGNKPTVVSHLKPALQEIMLRRRLDQIALELPPLRITTQYLPQDPELASRLEELGVEGDLEHMSTLRRVLGEYKAPRVAQALADEVEHTDLVVLYHHRDTGDELRMCLQHACNRHSKFVWGFDGMTPARDRQLAIDSFQKHGGVFLSQQTAAGTGITLTRAHEIVLVEPSWSPSENAQAIKRIHRIGQEHPCRARIFCVPESLDEAITKTLTRKTNMIAEAGL